MSERSPELEALQDKKWNLLDELAATEVAIAALLEQIRAKHEVAVDA